MADVGTHVAVPSTLLGYAYLVGHYPAHGIQNYVLLSTTEFTVTLAAGVAFLVGSVLPDIGGIGYWIAAKLAGKDIPILRQHKWKTKIFTRLDNRSYWTTLYKFPHSIVGSVSIFIVISSFLATEVLVGYIIGHTLHLVMDYPTHRTSWLLWPVSKISSKDPRWDWWLKWPYNTWWWEYVQWSIVGSTAVAHAFLWFTF